MAEPILQLTRSELMDYVTVRLLRRDTAEPTLVAIDGRSAAGKTTLADELALHVQAKGHPVLRSSIDDFHPPGHKHRRRNRPHTPSSYYAEGYDYATFCAFLLDPVRQGAPRCRPAYWDSFNDRSFSEEWVAIQHDAIVIVDGAFLLRPDLRQYWNYSIWLHIDWETMIERAAKRDVAWVGSGKEVAKRYREFWIPTHRFYETSDDPVGFATMIVDNQCPETPVVLKGGTADG